MSDTLEQEGLDRDIQYEQSSFLLMSRLAGGLAATIPAATMSEPGLPLLATDAPSPDGAIRIRVPEEDRVAAVGALLRTGGARALPGNRFDVRAGQLAALRVEEIEYEVEGQGEPLRDRATT